MANPGEFNMQRSCGNKRPATVSQRNGLPDKAWTMSVQQ